MPSFPHRFEIKTVAGPHPHYDTLTAIDTGCASMMRGAVVAAAARRVTGVPSVIRACAFCVVARASVRVRSAGMAAV